MSTFIFGKTTPGGGHCNSVQANNTLVFFAPLFFRLVSFHISIIFFPSVTGYKRRRAAACISCRADLRAFRWVTRSDVSSKLASRRSLSRRSRLNASALTMATWRHMVQKAKKKERRSYFSCRLFYRLSTLLYLCFHYFQLLL